MSTSKDDVDVECHACKQKVSLVDPITNNECKKEYISVETCMELNKGSISICKEEWSQFRVCFEKFKSNRVKSKK